MGTAGVRLQTQGRDDPWADDAAITALHRRAMVLASQELRRAEVWSDPAELSQEALTRLGAQDCEIANPDAWLRTAIRHLVIDIQRRQARESRAKGSSRDPQEWQMPLGGDHQDVDTVAQLVVREQFVEYLLSHLGERDRQIVMMRGIVGHPARHVASLLTLASPGAVDQAYRRALLRLRVVLEQQPDLLVDLRS